MTQTTDTRKVYPHFGFGTDEEKDEEDEERKERIARVVSHLLL